MLASAGTARAAVCGDADGDGDVTTRDGVRILHLVAASSTDCITEGCDVDRDGQITVRDGVLALRRAAGIPIADHCGPAAITGRLLVLPALGTTAAMVEQEPNDGPGTATVVGTIAPGRTRRLAGAIGADDPFDGWTFVAHDDLTLDLGLAFASEPGIDLDLLVDDRAGTSVTCESTTPGLERCRVALGALGGRAFDVVVAPAATSHTAAYTLTIEARAGTAPPGVTAGDGADAALDLEPSAYRGDAPAIIPGEVVLQLATPTTGADRGSARMARTVAAAIDGAGIPEGIAAEVVAPDGTVLLTLPALSAEAAQASGDPATTLAAKRARAAARARTHAVAAALAGSPGVRTARPNGLARAARIPGDPLYPRQWHFEVIGLPAAWETTIGVPTTIVAVVDTGIRSDHPDLASRLVAGYDFISGPGRANDGDGIDPDPFDPGDQPSTPTGGSYHGTHVAGTIAAATDNGRGVAGVTWRTAIMPLRVLGIGGGSLFDVAQAVRYAAGLPNASGTLPRDPARIINLSLTASGDDPALRSAVDAATEAGALVIAAAGNTGRNNTLSPAVYANTLSVAATDRLGAPARYASFGAAVDLAAPGGDTRRDRDADDRPDGILSTRLPARDDYALLQGSSMASAHVSGIAALLLGAPGAAGTSAARLREVLLATANDRGTPGRDDRYGAGLVDAARAMRLLTGRPAPSEPTLVLESPSLRIAADESAPRVPFRNVGGGTLVITSLTAATDDGVPWISPTIENAVIRVTADRTTLGAGEHTGRIRVTSNGGDAELGVVLSVSAGPPEDLGPVTVLLRDADDRSIVATTTALAADDYRYRFEAAPPGRYEIVASTDRDDDGGICDVGDVCGAYPERQSPTILTVFGGSTLEARDFGLALVVSSTDAVP